MGISPIYLSLVSHGLLVEQVSPASGRLSRAATTDGNFDLADFSDTNLLVTLQNEDQALQNTKTIQESYVTEVHTVRDALEPAFFTFLNQLERLINTKQTKTARNILKTIININDNKDYTLLAKFINAPMMSSSFLRKIYLPLLEADLNLAEILPEDTIAKREQKTSLALELLESGQDKLSVKEDLDKIFTKGVESLGGKGSDITKKLMRSTGLRLFSRVYGTLTIAHYIRGNLYLSSAELNKENAGRASTHLQQANNLSRIVSNYLENGTLPFPLNTIDMPIKEIMRFCAFPPNGSPAKDCKSKYSYSAGNDLVAYEMILRPYQMRLTQTAIEHYKANLAEAAGRFNPEAKKLNLKGQTWPNLNNLTIADILRSNVKKAPIIIFYFDKEFEKASLNYEVGARNYDKDLLEATRSQLTTRIGELDDLITKMEKKEVIAESNERTETQRQLEHLRLKYKVQLFKVRSSLAEDYEETIKDLAADVEKYRAQVLKDDELKNDFENINEIDLLLSDIQASYFYISVTKGQASFSHFKDSFEGLANLKQNAKIRNSGKDIGQLNLRLQAKQAKLLQAAFSYFPLEDIAKLPAARSIVGKTVHESLVNIQKMLVNPIDDVVSAMPLLELELRDTQIENSAMQFFLAPTPTIREAALKNFFAIYDQRTDDFAPRQDLWLVKVLSALTGRVAEPGIRGYFKKYLQVNLGTPTPGTLVPTEEAAVKALLDQNDRIISSIKTEKLLPSDLTKIQRDAKLQLANFYLMLSTPKFDQSKNQDAHKYLAAARQIALGLLNAKEYASAFTQAETYHLLVRIDQANLGQLKIGDEIKRGDFTFTNDQVTDLKIETDAELMAFQEQVQKNILDHKYELNLGFYQRKQTAGELDTLKLKYDSLAQMAGSIFHGIGNHSFIQTLAETKLNLAYLYKGRGDRPNFELYTKAALAHFSYLLEPISGTEARCGASTANNLNFSLAGFIASVSSDLEAVKLLQTQADSLLPQLKLQIIKPLPIEIEQAALLKVQEMIKASTAGNWLTGRARTAAHLSALSIQSRLIYLAGSTVSKEELKRLTLLEPELQSIIDESRGELSVEARLLVLQNVSIMASLHDSLAKQLEIINDHVLKPMKELLNRDSLAFKQLKGRAKYAALKSLADTYKIVGSIKRDLQGYTWKIKDEERESLEGDQLLKLAKDLYIEVAGSARIELVEEATDLALSDIMAISSGSYMNPKIELAKLEKATNDMEKHGRQKPAELFAEISDYDNGLTLANLISKVREAIKTVKGAYSGQLHGKNREVFFSQLASNYMRLGFLYRQIEGKYSVKGRQYLNLARYMYYETLKSGYRDLAAESSLNLVLIRYVETADKHQRLLTPDDKLVDLATKRGGKIVPLSLFAERDVLELEIEPALKREAQSKFLAGRSKTFVDFLYAQYKGRLGMVQREVLGKDQTKPQELMDEAVALIDKVNRSGIQEYKAEIQLMDTQLKLVRADEKTDENKEMEIIAGLFTTIDKYSTAASANLGSRSQTELNLIAIQAFARYSFIFRTLISMGDKKTRKTILAQLNKALVELDKNKQLTKETEASLEKLTRLTSPKDEANVYIAKAILKLSKPLTSGRKDLEIAGKFWLGQIAYIMAEDETEMLDIGYDNLKTAWDSDEIRGTQLLDIIATCGKILGQEAGIQNDAFFRLPLTVWAKAHKAEAFFDKAIELIKGNVDEGNALPKEGEKIIADILIESGVLVSWAEGQWNLEKTKSYAREGIIKLTAFTKLETRYQITLAKGYWAMGEMARYKDPPDKKPSTAADFYNAALEQVKSQELQGYKDSVGKKTMRARIYVSLGALHGQPGTAQTDSQKSRRYFELAQTTLAEIKELGLWTSEHKQIARSLPDNMRAAGKLYNSTFSADILSTNGRGKDGNWGYGTLHLKADIPFAGFGLEKYGTFRLNPELIHNFGSDVNSVTPTIAGGWQGQANLRQGQITYFVGAGLSSRGKVGPPLRQTLEYRQPPRLTNFGPTQAAGDLNFYANAFDTFSIFANWRIFSQYEGTGTSTYVKADVKPVNLFIGPTRLAYNPYLKNLTFGVEGLRYPLFVKDINDPNRYQQQFATVSSLLFNYQTRVPGIANDRLGVGVAGRLPLWSAKRGYFRAGEQEFLSIRSADDLRLDLSFNPSENAYQDFEPINPALRLINNCSVRGYVSGTIFSRTLIGGYTPQHPKEVLDPQQMSLTVGTGIECQEPFLWHHVATFSPF